MCVIEMKILEVNTENKNKRIYNDSAMRNYEIKLNDKERKNASKEKEFEEEGTE